MLKNQIDNFDYTENDKLCLVRRDLLHYEDIICQDFSLFIKFSAHSLYFPTQDELDKPKYLKSEKKILIPLRRENALLGILLLRDVSGVKAEGQIITLLEGIAKICLDKIYYLKVGILDEVCHLPRFNLFMQRVKKEILGIKNFFNHSVHSIKHASNTINTFSYDHDIDNDEIFPVYQHNKEFQNHIPDRNSSIGLMVLTVLGLEKVKKYYGIKPATLLFRQFSKTLKTSLPEECVCSVLSENSFAVLFPGATKRNMQNLAKQSSELYQSIAIKPKQSILASYHELPDEATIQACTAYALYPQDWDGSNDTNELEEIPHILLNKAKIAMNRLLTVPTKGSSHGLKSQNLIAKSSLAYQDILWFGGKIEAIFPYSQVKINLGKQDGAFVNMCFQVFEDAFHNKLKGEIILHKVYNNFADAEIIILNDPTSPLACGDYLKYISQNNFSDEQLDSDTTLYTYQNFTDVTNKLLNQNQIQNFSLALLRVQWKNSEADNFESEQNNKQANLLEIAKELLKFFEPEKIENDTLKINIGSMSFNSLIIYHPLVEVNELKNSYQKLLKQLETKYPINCALGISFYPFLNLRPADLLDACRKALDYAILLPAPNIGIYDTFAININADRKFSQGDIFEAIEEYRMSLLADSENILAWNSLGICLAELGRQTEARNAFERAYICKQDDLTTCYNLGNTNLALGDINKAKEYFLTCILHDKTNIYARVRLGEIAEKEHDYEEAKSQYKLAMEDNPSSSLPYRYLARLHVTKHENDLARELIQIALQKNPDDAISLQILANIYLEAKEDAQLAEVLIRQSIALMPWRRNAWATLAKALDAQGRNMEAIEVRRNSVRL